MQPPAASAQERAARGDRVEFAERIDAILQGALRVAFCVHLTNLDGRWDGAKG